MKPLFNIIITICLSRLFAVYQEYGNGQAMDANYRQQPEMELCYKNCNSYYTCQNYKHIPQILYY